MLARDIPNAQRGPWLLIALLLVPALGGCTSLPQTLPRPPALPDLPEISDIIPTSEEAPAPPATPPAAPPAPPAPPAKGILNVYFLDVGQGDAVLWELPDGSIVVYDCGPPVNATTANPVTRYLRERLLLGPGARLHALVASHGHLDHVGGCEEVLRDYQVAHVYETWYDGPDAPASYRRFRDQVRAEGAMVHTVRSTPALEGERLFHDGDLLDLPAAARNAGVRAEVLWPPGPGQADWDRIGEQSIVLRLSFGEQALCFQGDIEIDQEEELARRLGSAGCTVLLAGHHGSRFASSAPWLAKVRPQHAVVSFGENAHGHPAPEALCRLQQAGAKVYLTHGLGNIAAITDGGRLAIQPDRPEVQDYCAPGASYWT
jgi:competence protein ComEC